MAAGIQVIHLVPLGADGRMAGQAVVAEGGLVRLPRPGQAHQLPGELAVALEAGGFRIDLLAQREAGVGLRRRVGRRTLRFLARIVALMAGIAFRFISCFASGVTRWRRWKVSCSPAVGRRLLVPGAQLVRGFTPGEGEAARTACPPVTSRWQARQANENPPDAHPLLFRPSRWPGGNAAGCFTVAR
jgi:hypothetical protein